LRSAAPNNPLFPALDLALGPRWEFDFGIGVGLAPSTDRLIVKLILGYRFDLGALSGAAMAGPLAPPPRSSSPAPALLARLRPRRLSHQPNDVQDDKRDRCP